MTMRINKKVTRAHEKLESKRIGTFAVVYSIVLILLVLTLQTTLFPYLSIKGICFDATLPTAFFLAVYTNEYFGSAFGLVLGVFSDLIYPSAFPIMPVVYLCISALGGVVFKGMKKGCFIQKFFAGVLAIFCRSLIFALINSFTQSDPIAYIFGYEMWQMLYTAALTPIFMLICSPTSAHIAHRQ